jgi:hypothetical protein
MAEDQQVGPGLFVKLGINTSELVGGVGGVALALNQSLQLLQQFEAMGQEAFNATIGAAERLQEEIQHMAYVTGMSTDQVQKWRAAAIATGTDFSALSFSMQNLSARVTDTGAAGDDLRRTLANMGVSVKDTNGNFVDSDTLLKSILTKIDELPTAQQKDAAAKEIWGRSWANLASMINESGTALDAYNKKQADFSPVDLEKIQLFKIEAAQVNDQISIMGAQIGTTLIPVIQDFREGINLWTGVLQLDFNRVSSAMQDAQTRAETLRIATRDAWEEANKDLLAQSGKGIDWTLYNQGLADRKSKIDTSALLAGPQALQAKLDEITNVTLPHLRDKYIDAVYSHASQDDIDKAAEAYNKQIEQQSQIKDQIRDQNLSYQQMIDLTLPELKEKLEAAKKTGLKTDIEAANIALEQGINNANDYGAALGKAAISADSIKASITIASGWTSKSIVGAANSEMASFMVDEMQHGASYQVALDAWSAGVHSYSSWTNGEGTLGAAIDAGQSATRNPGKNEREALAASTTGTPGASPTAAKSLSLADRAPNDTKTISTELSKQADLYTTLNGKIKTGWTTQETDALIHYTALDGLAMVQMQKLMDDWGTTAGWISKTIAYEQTIAVINGVPAASPMTFDAGAFTAPTLAAADFSGIKFLASGEKKDSDKDKNAGGNTYIDNSTNIDQITANGVNNPQQFVSDVGKQIALNGGLGKS